MKNTHDDVLSSLDLGRAYSKRVPRTNCALRIKKCAPRISSGIYFFKHKLIIIGLDWIGELAKYCDERVCLWVGLSVCQSVREHISETTRPNFITFSWHVAYVMVVARYSFSDKIAIRYILPVL